jgi:hypothetical protein
VRSSTAIYHNSATTPDASSPSLADKTGFFGNNRAVNGHCAGLGDSGRDISAEQSVSSGIANARDCGTGYEEFAVHPSGLRKFTKFYRRGDCDCGIGYKEFAACSSGVGKFSNFYRR